MKDSEIGGTVTVGQILDALGSPAAEKFRDTEVFKSYTVGEAADILNSADRYLHLRDREVARPFTLRETRSPRLRAARSWRNSWTATWAGP